MYQVSHWVAVSLLIFSLVLWKPTIERARLRAAWGFLALWAAAWGATQFLPLSWMQNPGELRETSVALLELAGVQIAAVVVVDVLLRRVTIPRFAIEAIIVGSYIVILFELLFRLGVNVTGIFATSAVAAAVVGLALQDMLSNIAGGIALELEGGIRAGDFVKCGESAGWVQHVRLRHTAIRTTDGDTVILPNSQLTRNAVHIWGRAHRQFVPFSMPYSINPQEVITAVEQALRDSPLTDVAADPPPRCVIREMTPEYVKYAAVVWLARPGYDTQPVSAVLVRLYFALQRAGLPATEIARTLQMKTVPDSPRNIPSPMEILRRTPVLRLLDDTDLFELGSSLQYQCFGPGERILKQGDPGSSMYFVVSGTVRISIHTADGTDRQIASMQDGNFFGEASLLTGEGRSASVVAESPVECYQLGKAALQPIMDRRPELAEDMSVVMAVRLMELATVREKLDAETARRRQAENQSQFLMRIRRFFEIEDERVEASALN